MKVQYKKALQITESCKYFKEILEAVSFNWTSLVSYVFIWTTDGQSIEISAENIAETLHPSPLYPSCKIFDILKDLKCREQTCAPEYLSLDVSRQKDTRIAVYIEEKNQIHYRENS